MHIENRTVDLLKREARAGQIPPIILRRGEKGQTQIAVKVTDNGLPFNVEGYDARFCANLPDDKFVSDVANVTLVNDTATYTVQSNLTSCEGDITVCYVRFEKDGHIVTTDCIPIIVLDDVHLTSEEAEEYQNEIDGLVDEVRKQLQDVNSTHAQIKEAEQGRVKAEDERVSNEDVRKAAEDTRLLNEDKRESAEAERVKAEAERVKAELERIAAEAERVSAELERVSAETKRITDQAKNNADQAANNLAASQIAPYTCVVGEYDPAESKPTIEGSSEGRIYLVPTGSSGDDKYIEWMWLHGQWERMGTSSGGDITYITTDQVDSVFNEETPQGDTVLSLTGLSYVWAKIKAWGTTTFRKVADLIKTGDIENGAINADKIAANAVTDAKIAANAVTSAKINAGAVSNAKLADDAVTTDKIKDGTIVLADMSQDFQDDYAALKQESADNKAAWDSANSIDLGNGATLCVSGKVCVFDIYRSISLPASMSSYQSLQVSIPEKYRPDKTHYQVFYGLVNGGNAGAQVLAALGTDGSVSVRNMSTSALVNIMGQITYMYE